MTTIATKPPVSEREFPQAVSALDLGKKNGPPLAALLAAGIGAAALGLFTTLAQAHSGFKALMDLDKNFGLNKGVGPLSGKTIYAVAIWIVVWAIAAYVMRGKNYRVQPFLVATFVLIGIGLVGTFPIFFENFPVLQK
ncbi:MAG TPA: hypothetical protein VGA16_12540 [Candidatus Limnocylindria bacterium]